MKPEILISDAPSPRVIKIFKKRRLEVEQETGIYDGLAVRSATKIIPGIISVATKLKAAA